MDIYEAIETRKSVRAFKNTRGPRRRAHPHPRGRAAGPFGLQPPGVALRRRARRRPASAGRGLEPPPSSARAPVVLACCAETDGHLMPCGAGPSPSISPSPSTTSRSARRRKGWARAGSARSRRIRSGRFWVSRPRSASWPCCRWATRRIPPWSRSAAWPFAAENHKGFVMNTRPLDNKYISIP